MTISLIGAHGTGKTTIFNLLKAEHPDWQFFGENIRHLMPKFGYQDPYEMAAEVGSGAFQLMNVNAWCMIDPDSNSQFDKTRPAICDGAVISNYIYYQALRKTEADLKLENAFIRVASYYATLIDKFIYFPIGMIPLMADPMRPGDYDFQKRIDDQIPLAFAQLKIPPEKIYKLKTNTPEQRLAEVLSQIGNLNNSQ